MCKQENIELFIDDQLNNCLEISRAGIKVIRITDDENSNDQITNLSNWQEIYEFIGNNK